MSIYAVSLSAGQGEHGPRVSAHLLYSQDGSKTSVDLHWDLPHAIQANGSPTEWLYSVLSRLVADFDEHTIDRVEFDGVQTMKEDAR